MCATTFATLAFIPPVGVYGFYAGYYDSMKLGVSIIVMGLNGILIRVMVVLLIGSFRKEWRKWLSHCPGGAFLIRLVDRIGAFLIRLVDKLLNILGVLSHPSHWLAPALL